MFILINRNLEINFLILNEILYKGIGKVMVMNLWYISNRIIEVIFLVVDFSIIFFF